MPIAPTCEIKGCGKTFDEFGAIILSDPVGPLVVKKHICKTCYEKRIVPLLDGVTQVNMKAFAHAFISDDKSEEPKHKIEILKRCKELIETSHHAAAATLYSTKHHVSFEEAHSVMKDLREGKISIE